VSAVIVLLRHALNEFQLAVWRELADRQIRGEMLRPAASLEVVARLQHTLPVTDRFEDYPSSFSEQRPSTIRRSRFARQNGIVWLRSGWSPGIG